MSQAYSNPKRESDPYALPDVEVFYRTANDCTWTDEQGEQHNDGPGWYWWSCFPGCLPDSDPFGPFDTREDALADAQSSAADENEV